MELQDIAWVDDVAITYQDDQWEITITHHDVLDHDMVLAALSEAGDYTLIDFSL